MLRYEVPTILRESTIQDPHSPKCVIYAKNKSQFHAKYEFLSMLSGRGMGRSATSRDIY